MANPLLPPTTPKPPVPPTASPQVRLDASFPLWVCMMKDICIILRQSYGLWILYHLDKMKERKEDESRNSNKKTIKKWMVERKNWGTKREIEEEEAAANADLWRISNERGKGKRK